MYGCFCSRCSAGDTAAETTLFGLRCPKWAKYYPQTNKKQACNGIVKGLRRTDISSSGEMESDVDEPPSFRAVMNAPLHERAVCMQCNAKYDAATMQNEIVPLLKYMETLRTSSKDCVFIAIGHRDECADAVLKAEKFVYPTNYVYLAAKRMLMHRLMFGVEISLPILHADVAKWLKDYVREVLARVQAVGCQQMDFFGLHEIVSTYGYYAEIARGNTTDRREGGRGGVARPVVDAETRELLLNTAMCATQKMKLLLQIRDE